MVYNSRNMPKNNKNKIIAVVGPTASGKSDLAIKIAQKISAIGGPASGWQGAEIISADSRQVYRGMDIGTGKVTKKEQKLVKHHLIDVSSPKKQFTAEDFKKMGNKSIEEITAKNKIPIIAGGTGFYIDILLGRMQTVQVPPNKQLRAKLEKQSAEQLFKRLRKLDPERARAIDRHNKRRLIRALEIVITTGRPVPKIVSDIKYQVLWLGIRPADLEKRIKKRLDARLKGGMVNEVKILNKQGISWKRLNEFGLEYRWVAKYLQNKISRREMEENLYRDIVKYSKRQITWFKRNKDIKWINNKTAEQLARRFLD